MNNRVITCLVAAVLFVTVALASRVGLAQQAVSPSARGAAAARVTFSETIAPIVYANCIGCHRAGEAAPFPLITYEDVARRGALIARVTETRYMPPWHAAPGPDEFIGERRLTDQQIA